MNHDLPPPFPEDNLSLPLIACSLLLLAAYMASIIFG